LPSPSASLREVRVDGDLLTDTVLPAFEEGVDGDEPEERAFAMLGEELDGEIVVEDFVEVPEKCCDQNSFEPLPDSFLRKVEEEAQKQSLNTLGFLHSHPYLENSFPFAKTFLSETDYEKMVERDEVIRGVCVLPIGGVCSGLLGAVTAYVVFWHRQIPRTLPTTYKDSKSSYGIYLSKNENGWWIIPVS